MHTCHSSWAEKMDVLTSKSASDPEGYLAHPVNAYKLVKRLNTDWLELENLVLQDTTSGKESQGTAVGRQPCVLENHKLGCGFNIIAKFV